MTIEKRIREAIKDLGYPVAQNQYQGNEETYFVFNITALPQLYADDLPWADRNLIQLHLFAPLTLNTTQIKKTVRKDISDAGFTVPSVTPADEDEKQHIVFEFEVEEWQNWT